MHPDPTGRASRLLLPPLGDETIQRHRSTRRLKLGNLLTSSALKEAQVHYQGTPSGKKCILCQAYTRSGL